VFESESRDDYICRCAVDGCSVTSSALKLAGSDGYIITSSTLKVAGSDHDVSVQAVLDQKQVLRLVLRFCSDSRYHRDVFRSAVRSMTFNVLGLTHTCHDHGHNPTRCCPELPLSEDKIRDIQYTETKDVGLLEELLCEFKNAWDAAEGQFLDFINGY
jgi:hypothetical protein